MRIRTLTGFTAVIFAVFVVGLASLVAQAPPSPSSQKFESRDFEGSWVGTRQNFYGDDNTVPEPPLTAWAKEHLLLENISHAGLNATAAGASSANSNVVGAKDSNGVPANVAGGHYPGEKCETIAAPAEFNYTNAYPFLFIVMPDRIYQMFENHREWRTIWLNRDHPKNLFPTYLGDSVAKWDGNTLVVDTIGYNGRAWISENVGHYMSDAFHLVELYRLTDATHMDLEMTYYDPKAWGDKAWPGWKKEFKLDSKSDSLEEQICDPTHWQDYDLLISEPAKTKN